MNSAYYKKTPQRASPLPCRCSSLECKRLFIININDQLLDLTFKVPIRTKPCEILSMAGEQTVADIDIEILENELKDLIVETLRLEDVKPSEINSEDALFYDGLGLDSLDALELGVAISKKYGIKLTNDPEENRRVFASIQSMAQFILEQK
jgi:acyl carrier protein